MQNLGMITRLAKNRGFLPLFLAAMSPWYATSARAALGGDAASVLSDADDLRGAIHAELLQHYDIQDITADSGMHVREFLNHDGVVFAVTWSGPVFPDLQRLLGFHFAEYAREVAASRQPGMNRSAPIATPQLVVESGGHLRAYSGRAYLPELIPAGTSATELR